MTLVYICTVLLCFHFCLWALYQLFATVWNSSCFFLLNTQLRHVLNLPTCVYSLSTFAIVLLFLAGPSLIHVCLFLDFAHPCLVPLWVSEFCFSRKHLLQVSIQYFSHLLQLFLHFIILFRWSFTFLSFYFSISIRIYSFGSFLFTLENNYLFKNFPLLFLWSHGLYFALFLCIGLRNTFQASSLSVSISHT